jgi:hypothetical protein
MYQMEGISNKRLGLRVMLTTDPLKHVLLVIASGASHSIISTYLTQLIIHSNFDQYQVDTMSFVRTNTAASDRLVSCNGARTTHWQTPRSGNSVMEIQTYPDSSTITEAQRQQLNPPKHFHWTQKEYFTVTQGCVVCKILHVPESSTSKAAMSHVGCLLKQNNSPRLLV